MPHSTPHPIGTLVYDHAEGICEVTGHLTVLSRSSDKGHPTLPGERPTTYVLRGHRGTSYCPVHDGDALPRVRPLVSREHAEAMLATLRREARDTVASLAAEGVLTPDNDVARRLQPAEAARVLRVWYGLPDEAFASGLSLRVHSLERHVLGEIAAVLGVGESGLRAEMRAAHPSMDRWEANADARAEARRAAMSAANVRKRRTRALPLP